MTMTTDTAGRWVPAPGSVARHNWPLPARWAWWLLHRLSLALLLAATATVGMLAGPVLLGAVAVTVGLLLAWAAVERRVTDRVRARPGVVERGPRGPGRLDGDHVAFARGLAGLAGWYLAECERQEREALR